MFSQQLNTSRATIPFEKVFELLCYLLVFGLFFSRAILSISSVLIFLLGILKFGIKKSYKNPISSYLIFPIIFCCYLLSIVYTDNLLEWKHIVFKNSVMLWLPVGFYFNPQLEKKKIEKILFIITFLGFICVFSTAIKSLFNYQETISAITNSKNIESFIGPQHSELGIISTISFILLVYFLANEKEQKRKLYLLITAIIFFVALNIIAYRFTLLSIYTIASFVIVHQIIIKKKFKYLISLTILCVIAISSLIVFPPLKSRYQNTINDLQSVFGDKNPNYQSIGQRWGATKCAIEVIKKAPYLGVSPADLIDEMNKQYDIDAYYLIPENRIFIHNQFIFYASSFGIIWLLMFLLTILYCIKNLFKKNFLLFLICLAFLMHMQIENSLEKQITLNLIIFVPLLMINFALQQNENKVI